MAVSIKVNGVSHTLVHRGSQGVSAATLPDVCRTPMPGGPVAVPYPNVSRSATLSDGTVSVKVDGGMSAAVKGSVFASSSGDEAGALGGVASGTCGRESSWILYSFDVKMEGRNACRLTDKMLQNHGNSADLAGEMQMALVVRTLQDMVCECDQQVQPQPGDTCPSLGQRKHACMNSKIALDRSPLRMVGETAYVRKTGRPAPRPHLRMWLVGEPIHAFFRRIRGNIYPDATILDDQGRPEKFAEFKFRCPAKVPVRRGGPLSTGVQLQAWSRGQRQRTIDLGLRQDPVVTQLPELISNEAC